MHPIAPILRAAPLLIAALAAIGLTACDSVNTTERLDPVASPDIVIDKRVITDGELERVARVRSVRQATVSGNILKVDVDVTNTHGHSRIINYKFEWFDDHGMSVNTPLSTWQPRVLQGGETITLTGVAPTPQAKDFRLKLQLSTRD